VLAVSIVASLTVIACGSSPAAPTPSATTSTTTTPTPTPAPPSPAPATTAPDGTLLLEGLPVDLSQLNYSDIVARREGRDPEWLPLDDFGRLLPVSSARPVSMPNPQPTFYAPLGTPVYAVVSGVVSQIPTLYSRDYSVMISSGERGGVWEHEHIMNVTVRVGDRVTAGQRIGEVSDYECTWSRNSLASDPLCQSRLGLVEIGPCSTAARRRSTAARLRPNSSRRPRRTGSSRSSTQRAHASKRHSGMRGSIRRAPGHAAVHLAQSCRGLSAARGSASQLASRLP
jgi:biotin carboxyl carrier protein